jgi:hypothetical protein
VGSALGRGLKLRSKPRHHFCTELAPQLALRFPRPCMRHSPSRIRVLVFAGAGMGKVTVNVSGVGWRLRRDGEVNSRCRSPVPSADATTYFRRMR